MKRFNGILGILGAIVALLWAEMPVAAASYTMAAFSRVEHPVSAVSWVMSAGLESSGRMTWEYRESETAITGENATEWIQLADGEGNCQLGEGGMRCEAVLPQNMREYVQFRLTYPDSMTLAGVNYQLVTAPERDMLEASGEALVFYSNFKMIDEGQKATQISWREVALTEVASDEIMVQTRASEDGETWTEWRGNGEKVASGSAEASGEGELVYILADLAASGMDEQSAMQNKSFRLNTVAGLYLGARLELTEIVGADTYQAWGIVNDIKESDKSVSVWAWRGAIPFQLTSNCEGETFCFSPRATVKRLTDESEGWRVAEAGCLEYEEVMDGEIEPACKTKMLLLDEYYAGGKMLKIWQYRIIYGENRDKVVSEVFLHQEAVDGTSSALQGNFLNRLRGGKVMGTTNAGGRVFYWN